MRLTVQIMSSLPCFASALPTEVPAVKTFAMHEARLAHTCLQTGQTTGKMVVTIPE